jgi:hypothetical protein
MIPICSTLLTLALVGCSAGLGAPEHPGPLAVTRFRAEPYSYTSMSRLRQSERLVIRDNSEWQAAWALLWPANAPIPAPPQVDFSHDMVVLAALGERPSGGFGILVDSATASTAGVTVWISTTAPGVRCFTTAALTQPVDLARLPRTDAAVQFRDVAKVVDCQ